MTEDKTKYTVRCDRCKQLKGSLALVRAKTGLKMLCAECVKPYLTVTRVPKIQLVKKKTKVKGRKKK